MNSGVADRILATLIAGILAAYLSTTAWLLGIFIGSAVVSPEKMDSITVLVVFGAVWFVAGVGAVFGMVGATLLLAIAFAVVERLPLGWTHRRACMAAGAAAGTAFVILAHLPDVQFVYSSRHVLGVWFLRKFLEQGPVIATWASLVPPLAGVIAGLAYSGLAPRPARRSSATS